MLLHTWSPQISNSSIIVGGNKPDVNDIFGSWRYFLTDKNLCNPSSYRLLHYSCLLLKVVSHILKTNYLKKNFYTNNSLFRPDVQNGMKRTSHLPSYNCNFITDGKQKLLPFPPKEAKLSFSFAQQLPYKNIFCLATATGNLRFFFFARALLSKYCSSVMISIINLSTLSQEKKIVLAKAPHFLYYLNANTSGTTTNIAGADQKLYTILKSKTEGLTGNFKCQSSF